jgi:subtilisin-like proprotein convertase family protein
VVGIVAVLLLAAGQPAWALTKQQILDEMTSLNAQIAAAKGDPAMAGQLAQLLARFDELVAELGYRPSFPWPGPVEAPQGGGGPGVPPNCQAATDSFPSTDTPLPINDLATTTSTLAVSGVGTYIHDVNVSTSITHTWNADLNIILTSPSGTAVTLSTANGGSNDNVFNGTLWDDHGGATNPPGPATDNLYANLVVETPLVPEEALAHFRGEDPNGNWTLAVTDTVLADVGTLATWTLTLVTFTGPPIETTTSFPSTDTPLPIDDFATTASTLAVSGLDTYICDVDVNTSITHTWNADIDMILTSPGPTASTMTTANGGSNDNVFNGTLWDDSAGATNPPGPASDNLYANLVVETPLCFEEAAGAFIGDDPNGNWSLAITDTGFANTGTLATWSLDVTTCACGLPVADLEILKTGGVDSGTMVAAYTISVTDNGPADATGVVVTDPLPACMTFIGDDCGGSDVPPWTWNVGTLAASATVTCTLTLDAAPCLGLNVPNTATVTGNVNDPNPGNDSSTAAIFIPGVPIPTLDVAGLAGLVAALAGAAVALLRRRRPRRDPDPGP